MPSDYQKSAICVWTLPKSIDDRSNIVVYITKQKVKQIYYCFTKKYIEKEVKAEKTTKIFQGETNRPKEEIRT